MKKLLGVLVLGMVFAAAVHADVIQIDWKTWMFDHDATDLTDDSGDVGILNNYDVLWQLIHTDDAIASEPDLSAPNYLGAGEELFSEDSFRYLTGSNHGVWDMALFNGDDILSSQTVDKATTSSYYVYQRIYELNVGETAPSEGTWYYDSEVTDLASLDNWNAGTPYLLSAMGNDAQDYGVKPNQQIPTSQSVPEPATMGLLGLGALVLGLRRRLRK